MFRCRVTLLDDTYIERYLEKGAVGQVLFDKVCEHLSLLERDYFGLALWCSPDTKEWLDLSKEVYKQITGHDATFTFNVKFYPPDPSILAEDITRYLLCLQLRMDIMTSRLPCPSDVLAELGSYTVQSELGEYDADLHGQGYLSNIPLSPHQSPELQDAVMELHRSHNSMTPAEADKLFLQKASSLPMYGVDRHPAKDASGEEVILGVCADGLNMYEGETQTDSFLWPRVLQMSYKRSRFLLRILQEEDDSESTIIFKLPNYRACKRLWKTALEHHAFFRNHRQDRSFPSLLHVGSKFRFHGNTHTECLEASSNIKRPPLHVTRSAIKRKAKESMLETLKRPNRTELDDWFQVLDVDQSQPRFGLETSDADQPSMVYTSIGSKTYRQTHSVTSMDAKSRAYEEGEEPEEEAWPQQLDMKILRSAESQGLKQPVDDWFDLLDPRASKSSLQSSQPWKQRQELEKNLWEEGTSEESVKIVKMMKEVQYRRDGSEGLEVETRLKRADFAGESLEMSTGEKQPMVKIMEVIDQMGGARLQNVVIHKQRTQEVQGYDGQPQDIFTERKIKVEIIEGKQELLVGGQVVSEETIEGFEKNVLEVENTEQRLQDVEDLKVRLQEGEILVQKQQQAEQEQGQRRQGDDWHILMNPRPLAAGAKMEVSVQRGELQRWVEEPLQSLHAPPPIHTEDDWHVLLDLPPRTPQESWFKPSASLQPSQMWDQRQELEKNEWEEGTSEESVKVIKMMKEVRYRRDGPEGSEVETRLKRADFAGESLEMSTGEKQPVVKVMEGELEEQKEFEWRQDLLVGGQAVSEETIEGLQKKILEVESIEQRLQDLEGLKVRLHEVEILEQKLQEAEQERSQRKQTDDWHILMNPKRLAAGAKMEVSVQRGELQRWVEEPLQRPHAPPPIHTEDDWHVLLDLPPRSPQESWFKPSADVGRPVVPMVIEGRKWEEERRWQEERREDSQVKDIFQVKESLPPTTAGQREAQPQREVKDDWFVHLHRSGAVIAPPVAVMVTDEDSVAKKSMAEEERRQRQVVVVEQPESQTLLRQQRAATPQRESHDDWFTLLHASPVESGAYEDAGGVRTQQRVTIVTKQVSVKAREVTIDEKATIIREKPLKVEEAEKNIPVVLREVDDSWFVLFHWTPFERRSVGTVKLSSTWLLEESRAREVQEKRLREEERRKKETRALQQRAEEPPREVADDWFVLMETSPIGVGADRRATEEQTWKERAMEKEKKRVMEEERKTRVMEEQKKRVMEEERKTRVMEEQHKRVMEEERRKRAALSTWEEKDDWFKLLSVSPQQPALKLPSVPVISPVPVAVPKPRPLPPADQPMTSTPTAPFTRPTYQEERTKRLDITQESEVETESVLIRERKSKRIEGETIFIRHSILMLEDFDVTPEVVLRHHASIRELKRLFLEDVPVYGPTEWDKRLSTHSPVKIPKVTNGDLFLGMELMGNEILVM
ncbi:protein 4.1b [Brachyhypopomus gauderio]|uniref:protein 4.1b n=1 Tax=Brachyhypopomus gauderio TaxID=698409 RepID=UPI004042FDF5